MTLALPTEDILAIHDLLARYCHGMDAARADLVMTLFTEDAEMTTQVGNPKGQSAIRSWIEERLAQRDPAIQVGHNLINPLITASSPNEARVRSMLLYTHQRVDFSQPCQLVATGIYEDRVVRTALGWQFKFRQSSVNAKLDDQYFGI
ncbi:nuclear transport factor 2 family protein [Aequoribacter sp.]|uniref:nuclear transport factor 2 family protein n=1 Tax=Aequoribacter sp. TaxID=2847771 RepID=UPI003F696CFA